MERPGVLLPWAGEDDLDLTLSEPAGSTEGWRRLEPLRQGGVDGVEGEAEEVSRDFVRGAMLSHTSGAASDDDVVEAAVRRLTFIMLTDSEKRLYVEQWKQVRAAHRNAAGYDDPSTASRPGVSYGALGRRWRSIYHHRTADVLDKKLRRFLSQLCKKYNCCDVDKPTFPGITS